MFTGFKQPDNLPINSIDISPQIDASKSIGIIFLTRKTWHWHVKDLAKMTTICSLNKCQDMR